MRSSRTSTSWKETSSRPSAHRFPVAVNRGGFCRERTLQLTAKTCVSDMSPTQNRRSQPRTRQPLQIAANALVKRVKRVAFGITN